MVVQFCIFRCRIFFMYWKIHYMYKKEAEMCSERNSPLKRLYRQTHAKLTRLADSGQLVWAAGCELSLVLVHARRPASTGPLSDLRYRRRNGGRQRNQPSPQGFSQLDYRQSPGASTSAGAPGLPLPYKLAAVEYRICSLQRNQFCTCYCCVVINPFLIDKLIREMH